METKQKVKQLKDDIILNIQVNKSYYFNGKSFFINNAY